jgi:hypothetical protein
MIDLPRLVHLMIGVMDRLRDLRARMAIWIDRIGLERGDSE